MSMNAMAEYKTPIPKWMDVTEADPQNVTNLEATGHKNTFGVRAQLAEAKPVYPSDDGPGMPMKQHPLQLNGMPPADQAVTPLIAENPDAVEALRHELTLQQRHKLEAQAKQEKRARLVRGA